MRTGDAQMEFLRAPAGAEDAAETQTVYICCRVTIDSSNFY